MSVINFQGQRNDDSGELQNIPIVADMMTKKLIVFRTEDPIYIFMEKIKIHRISGGPVVDSTGALIGIVSEAECMKQISEGRYYNIPILDKTVKDFMTTNPITVYSHLNLFEVASKFHETAKRRFPVLDEQNKLVGQISRRDVVIAALNLKGTTWHKR